MLVSNTLHMTLQYMKQTAGVEHPCPLHYSNLATTRWYGGTTQADAHIGFQGYNSNRRRQKNGSV